MQKYNSQGISWQHLLNLLGYPGLSILEYQLLEQIGDHYSQIYKPTRSTEFYQASFEEIEAMGSSFDPVSALPLYSPTSPAIIHSNFVA